VERYKGRPFALLGVNVDSSPSKVNALREEGKVTWPSFSGDVENVVRAYGVHAIPTVILIDHKGIAREGWVMPSPDEIDKKVAELVAEAEGGR
jgi:hypothetical protein